LKVRLTDIEVDLKAGEHDALYYATEKQINMLIGHGHISEDFCGLYQDYQEEMRCMLNA